VELDLRGELDRQHASHHQVYRARGAISDDIGRGGPSDPGERRQVKPGAVGRIVHLEQKMGPNREDAVSAKAKGTFNFPETAPFAIRAPRS
jgi:hypothetical protein